MATGRTVLKWSKVYVDGYDLTGYSRTFGPLTETFDEADTTTIGDAVKNALPNLAAVNIGTLNLVLDNTASVGSHAVMQSQTERVVMLPIGIRADPAQGDPAFCGQFMQKDFQTEVSDGAITISAPFSGWAADASTLLYNRGWGTLLHAKAAKTAVNSSTGVDDRGAATAAGGYMCYQVFSSNGTVAIKVQDAAANNDGDFGDLVTSGNVDASTTPASGIVALGATAAVKRYLRWQIALGTATTVTFAVAFVRI